MTPDQLAILNTELVNDPKGLGYLALLTAGALGAVCDLLNAPTQSALGELSAARAITWGASGPMSAIVDASNNAAHPARASCLSFLRSLDSGMPVDMTNAAVAQLFAGWVAAGVITQAQSDAAVALATRPASRAAVLELPTVSVEDIHAAGA